MLMHTFKQSNHKDAKDTKGSIYNLFCTPLCAASAALWFIMSYIFSPIKLIISIIKNNKKTL